MAPDRWMPLAAGDGQEASTANEGVTSMRGRGGKERRGRRGAVRSAFLVCLCRRFVAVSMCNFGVDVTYCFGLMGALSAFVFRPLRCELG